MMGSKGNSARQFPSSGARAGSARATDEEGTFANQRGSSKFRSMVGDSNKKNSSLKNIARAASLRSLRESLSVTSLSVDEEASGQLPRKHSAVAIPEPPPELSPNKPGSATKLTRASSARGGFVIPDERFTHFSFDVETMLQPTGGGNEYRTFIALPHDGFRFCMRVLVIGLQKAVQNPEKYWLRQKISRWEEMWDVIRGSLLLFFRLEENVFLANLEGIVAATADFDIRGRSIHKDRMIISSSALDALLVSKSPNPQALTPEQLRQKLSTIAYGFDSIVVAMCEYFRLKERLLTGPVLNAWPERADRDGIDRKMAAELVNTPEYGPELSIIYTMSLNTHSRWKWRKQAFSKLGARAHRDVATWEGEFFRRMRYFLEAFDITKEQSKIKDDALPRSLSG